MALLTGIHGRRCAATRRKKHILKLFLPVFKPATGLGRHLKILLKCLLVKGFSKHPTCLAY